MTETEQLLTAILDCRRVDLAIRDKALNTDQQAQLEKMMKRRAAGEPLQYIIGHCDFMGVRFIVDKRALIPRPETEVLVESAIAVFKEIGIGRHVPILDLGTGSGNIAVTLARNVPGSTVTALDVDESALTLALRNAKANHVEKHIDFVCRDMLSYLVEAPKANKKFDMIISNPPYIKIADLPALPEDVKQEPVSALNGGADGLKYIAAIIRTSHKLLSDRGVLMFEFGDGQRTAIEHFFKDRPEYSDVRFGKDLAGRDRFICARMAR